MTAEEKQKMMLEMPVPRLILKLAVPTIISMLVTSFYNMADTLFVGMLHDTAATAAVGVVFPYMAVLQAIGFMFGHGAGNYISRALGAGEKKKASQMASVSFFCSLAVGTLLAVFGFLFMNRIAYLFGATDTNIAFTRNYFTFILIASPYMMTSFVLNNQLRFQGSASFAMIGIVVGAVINIGLDPLLMFVFDMKVQGAAVATAISQLVSFLILLWGTMRGGNLHLHIKNFTFKLWVYKEILRGGIPSLCRQGLASISGICLNNVAGALGAASAYGADAVIGGMGIVNRIMMFANSAMIGFGQGMQPVVGFNLGGGKPERIKEAFWFCVKWAVLALGVIAAVGLIFAPQIVRWFQEDEGVRQVAGWALRFQCISFICNAWIVPSNMMLQAGGKTLGASLLAASRNGLMFLPPLYLLSHFFGIWGMQISQPIADVLSALLAIPFTLSFLRELKAKK